MSDEQVSERESLARAFHADDLKRGRADPPFEDMDSETRDWYFDQADAALAWFAEHREPRVVSTVEEVESMPPGTVFRDRIWGSILYRRDDDLAPIGTVVGGGYWIANGWEVLFTPTTESED